MATSSSSFLATAAPSVQGLDGRLVYDAMATSYSNSLAPPGAFTPRSLYPNPLSCAVQRIDSCNLGIPKALRGLPETPQSLDHVVDRLAPLKETGDHPIMATGAAIHMRQQQSPLPSQHGEGPRQPLSVKTYATGDLDNITKWDQEKERIVRAPFEYAVSHPGKDFRSQLITAFNAWLEVPPASLETISKVVGMLHESSLLLDDVQDSSELRRGFPVAHSIFGIPQTINSANYICHIALLELQKLESPRLITIFTDEIINLYRGQGMELFWRDTLSCPTEEDYLEMVSNKTGGLFRLGIRLMQAESATGMECTPLVNLISLIFQIRDDLLNLSSEYTKNKGICEDLTEGKFSFPIIHSIRSGPNSLQLINILKQRTSDEHVKRYAVSYMEQTGSFTYTRAILSVLIERARDMVFEIDAGRGKTDSILGILAKMVVE